MWRAVVGFEGRYEVSDRGRVRSLMRPGRSGVATRGEPRLLALGHAGDGYVTARLYRDDVRSDLYVHRMVLEAFSGSSPDGTEAAHIDGSRSNNAAENLRWTTKRENQSHRILHGTDQFGERNASSKLSHGEVLEIRSLCARGVRQRVIAQRFGVSQSNVSMIATHSTWRH